ncbi:MAG: relaxase/mobilization nuclease domain-containing protein [Prolixibacteraceae bacterium]|nr:relaxase/mobilization nuclease domain-containing protein [Prolixibacteraceae bacterium]
MIAKIVKGQGFRGVVNYILNQEKKAEILDSDGVMLDDPEAIIESFNFQTELNPRILKPVGHISLNFSIQDQEKFSSELMVKIARDYMAQMGITDTQYLIARHYDKEHPHIHLVFNRTDYNGHTISDRNDRFRSEKICKELTREYGLYFAQGKENVKEHRLKEPDKTKYEIYHALQSAISKCRNWQELKAELLKSGIKTEFQNNGATDKIQGVRFGKNGYEFNGSKIDRTCSYSKISYQLYLNEKLRQNEGQQHSAPNQSDQLNRQDNTIDFSSGLENATSVLGGLFDFMNPSHHYDENEADFLKEQARRRKKKKDNQYRHRL